MPIFQDILKNIFKGGDGKIAEIIKETADELIYTKEEKAQAETEHQKWAEEQEYRNKVLDYENYSKNISSLIELEKVEVENTKDARSNEIEVVKQAPEKLWGISINIRSIIAIIVISFIFVIFFSIFYKKVDFTQNQYNLLFLVLGSLLGFATSILNYYFGSSDSSASKNAVIENMSKQNKNA